MGGGAFCISYPGRFEHKPYPYSYSSSQPIIHSRLSFTSTPPLHIFETHLRDIVSLCACFFFSDRDPAPLSWRRDHHSVPALAPPLPPTTPLYTTYTYHYQPQLNTSLRTPASASPSHTTHSTSTPFTATAILDRALAWLSRPLLPQLPPLTHTHNEARSSLPLLRPLCGRIHPRKRPAADNTLRL